MPRQLFSEFILGFYICETCGWIDRDMARINVGHPCQRCGGKSARRMSYFALPIPTVGDLIGELHPLPELDAPDPSAVLPIKESHKFALLVFFCTLAEVLLQHFLQRYMHHQSIPFEVQRRLLSDNTGMKRRIDKLFPSIVGMKWAEAIKRVKETSGTDFANTVAFVAKAAAKRNLLLHLGHQWAIPAEMPELCFQETAPLIRLFVELHNTFLAKAIDKPTSDGIIPAA